MDLELAPESAQGAVTFESGQGWGREKASYTVDVEESTPERSVFTLTDTTTGEVYRHDSATATTSIAFAIPVAFAAVSVSTALYYLAIGAAIVLAGALALEASKAIPKIVERYNRERADRRRSYYPASRSGDKVFIGGNGLTSAQAQARGRRGQDVWSISRTSARSLAKTLNPSGSPVGPEKHGGSGYLWHYHPSGRSPHMHSFYGS